MYHASPLLAIGAALSAAVHFWHGWTTSSVWDLVNGVVLLMIAGMAGQKTWNEPRAGIAVLLGLVIAAALRLAIDRDVVWSIFSLGICFGLLVWWWQTYSTRRRFPDQPPLVSLVLLLKTPQEIDAVTLADAATRAFGVQVVAIDPSDEDLQRTDEPPSNLATSAPSVIGAMPYFVVQLQQVMLAVHLWDGPYFEDAADYAHVVDDMVLQAIAEHLAWLSVDLLAGARATTSDDLQNSFQPVARLLAELATDEPLAIVYPATVQVASFTADSRSILRRENPLGLFDDAPRAGAGA